MDFVAVAAGQTAIGGGLAGLAHPFHVYLVDVHVAAAEAGCPLLSRGGEGLRRVADETEGVILAAGAGPPAVRVGSEQQGTLSRPVRVVALETLPFHAGRMPVLAGIFFPVMALEAEILDPLAVQTSVEAVAGVAPAIGQRAMAPRAQESGQAGAVRVVTGEAGSAVTADTAVGTQKTLPVTVVTLSAQRVALFHEHEPFLVAVIEVTFAALPVGEGRMNAAIPVTEGPRFVTLVAGFGGFRGRGSGGEKKGRQEKQDTECSHASILPSFLEGNGKRSGKGTLFLSHGCPGNNIVLAERRV